jgi:hypothetical protein
MMNFSALDLLTIDDDEQALIRFLSRNPDASIADVAHALAREVNDVEQALDTLVKRGRVVECMRNGSRVFRIRFGRTVRHARNLPGELLAAFEERADRLVARNQLTKDLPDARLRELLDASTHRRLDSDEVLMWQGRRLEQVGLLRRGLMRSEHLQGNQARDKRQDHVYCGEWIGVVDLMSDCLTSTTLISVGESEILLWPIDYFLEFLHTHSSAAFGLGSALGQQLKLEQSARWSGSGALWVVRPATHGAGASAIAGLLTTVCAREKRERIALWRPFSSRQAASASDVAIDAHVIDAGAQVLYGLDPFDAQRSKSEDSRPWGQDGLPRSVQLDICTARLRSTFDYVICDASGDIGRSKEMQTLITRIDQHGDVVLTVIGSIASSGSFNVPGPAAGSARQRRMAVGNFGIRQHPDVELNMKVPFAQDMFVSAAITQEIEELHRRLLLTHSIAIFVPSTVDTDEPLDNTENVRQAIAFFGDRFGGAVSNEADGAWKSADKGLVTERVTIVRAFVSKQALTRHLDDVMGFAQTLKREMRQEAVALDVDNQLVLV